MISLSSVSLRSVALLGISIGGTGIAYLGQIIVARALGAEQYGYFAYVIALVSILVFIAQMGYDYIFIRHVGVYRDGGKHKRLGSLLTIGFTISFGAAGSMAVAVTAYYVIAYSDIWSQSFFDTLYWGMASVPVLAGLYLCVSAMIGLHKQLFSKFMTEIVRSTLFVGAAVALAIFASSTTPSAFVILNLVIGTVILIAVLAPLMRALPRSRFYGAMSGRAVRRWSRQAIPLLIFSIPTVLVLQIDTIMLGTILGPQESGTYWAAAKLASLTAFPLYAANTIVAPMIAQAYAEGRRFDDKMRSSLVVSIGLCLCLIIAIIVFANPLLGLMGKAFVAEVDVIYILCAGYFLATLIGPVDYALTMTGHERFSAIVTGAGLCLCIGLNILLIPVYGGVGAALSTAISLVSIRLALMIGVLRFHRILHVFQLTTETKAG